jgi:molybdopterin converting factor small subunit
MKIKSFGKLTDIIQEEETVDKEISGWFDLQSYLFYKYPSLKEEKFTVALNLSIKNREEDFDEISLMPPFSGG